jgi:hypothetical protein
MKEKGVHEEVLCWMLLRVHERLNSVRTQLRTDSRKHRRYRDISRKMSYRIRSIQVSIAVERKGKEELTQPKPFNTFCREQGERTPMCQP